MFSSFIIVAQPTGSDGEAVTQYVKNASGHSARLDVRIICLLDPDIVKNYVELSDIGIQKRIQFFIFHDLFSSQMLYYIH